MKNLKEFPKFFGIEEQFPTFHRNKAGKVVYDILTVQVISKFILNKKAVGKIFYKDYAELNAEETFETNRGMLKIYQEDLGIFINADNFLKNAIYEYFNEEDTKEVQNCCQFFKSKNTDEAVRKILLPGIKYEINRVLEKLGNNWNASFPKKFLSIAFKNGTLIMSTKNKKWKFVKEKSYKYLATTYFNTDFVSFLEEKKENRLFNFLKFKLGLDTEEKEQFIKALIFDWFFIENKSHHIICFVGKHSSGKSTFMEHIKSFSNFSSWCSTISLSRLVGSKFSNPEWFYSNNIFCNETSEKYFKDNSTFKLLVAKEVLSVEQKGIDPIFLRAFSKLICLGEDPIKIKTDGGTDKRIMNFKFSNSFFLFSEKERYDYIDYINEIKEEDKTDGDALLQYLSFKKYEDMAQILIQGFIEFCNKNYADNKRSFKTKYEEIFELEMEEFAKIQNPYLVAYETYFEPCKNACINLTALIKIVQNLEISNISVAETLREQLDMLKTKVEGYKDIKEYHNNSKNIKVETERGIEVLARKNHFVFGIKLRNKEEINDLIASNKFLQGENSVAKYNNLIIPFKILNEKSYNEIFPKEMETIKITPHGQGKKVEKIEKTVDEMAQELKQLFKVE